MKLTFRTLFIASTCMVLLNACKKEVAIDKLESDTLDASFGIPLAEVTFNMERSIKKVNASFIEINPNTGLLEYVYSKQLFDIVASDVFTFNIPSISNSVSMPPAAVGPFNTGGAGTTVNFGQQVTEIFTFPNNEEVDSIEIISGGLNIDLESYFTHDGVVNVTIPSLKLNGVPLSTTMILDYTATVPVLVNNPIDISGYTFDLTDSGTTSNTGLFNFNIQLTHSGVPATGAESINTTMQFIIADYRAIHGNFGSTTNIISQDTIKIDFFENILSGTVHFEDPRIELNVTNSFGISVKTTFNAVYSPDNTSTVTIGGAGLNIPTFMGATSIGASTTTTHIINNANTSPTLSTLIDEEPTRVIYDFGTITNPNPGDTINFITPNSRVTCDSKMVLPLYGWASDFDFRDTNNFNISDLFKDTNLTNQVKSATIRVMVTNGLPIANNIQVYFTDTNFVIIDSLFTSAAGEVIVPGAVVNTSVPMTNPNYGKVIASSYKKTDITVSQSKLKALADNGAKKIIVVSTANTSEISTLKSVKFLPEYNLKVKISAKVDLAAKL